MFDVSKGTGRKQTGSLREKEVEEQEVKLLTSFFAVVLSIFSSVSGFYSVSRFKFMFSERFFLAGVCRLRTRLKNFDR